MAWNGIRGAAAALLAFGLAGAGAPAQAQTVLTPDKFDEFYTGAEMVMARRSQSFTGAARVVVSVSLGAFSTSAPLKLDALRVAAPNGPGGRLCVRLATSDGRYSASGDYAVNAAFDEPPTLGVATDYTDALGKYKASDLLVLAERGASCSAAGSGPLTPAVASAGADKLIVALNLGRGDPVAWVEKDGEKAAKAVRCRRAGGVTKTHTCAVAVAGLSGEYELVVRNQTLDGRSFEERSPLVLP